MSLTTGTVHTVIEKLNENNYAEWKTDLNGWMLEHGLSSFIADKAPVIPSEEGKLELFLAKRERAAGVIIQRLDKACQVRFITNESRANPNALWKRDRRPLSIHGSINSSKNIHEFSSNPKVDNTFLAEIVVRKFSDELEIARESLAEKRPLSLTVVLECLDKHKIEADEKKKKSDSIALSVRPRTSAALHSMSMSGEDCGKSRSKTLRGTNTRFPNVSEPMTLLNRKRPPLQTPISIDTMHDLPHLMGSIQSFTIHKTEGHTDSDDVFTYEVFDQNHSLNYKLKNRRGCFNMVEESKGDDGCVYNRRTHLLSRDQYSFDLPLYSKKETFRFEHKHGGFTGIIVHESTAQAMATILESDDTEVFCDHEYKLESNQVVPNQNLLGFLGLIIAAREEDRRNEGHAGIACNPHNSFNPAFN
ncbi:hypothetical protein CROQUDRAFT_109875 [Cronartium quercuum f. sp. fusiforme G11]|uniref:Uncharacterized protein n=1 Tax=Cronartium quercuum f. sp. fusiforme G11 TaxID=708437 RepID=A0A9P6NB77_9BASI|nr:hypothetical protein CROQUDRAFT_109875 [Cronartium quercuum f. sp. fusiforme G11]